MCILCMFQTCIYTSMVQHSVPGIMLMWLLLILDYYILNRPWIVCYMNRKCVQVQTLQRWQTFREISRTTTFFHTLCHFLCSYNLFLLFKLKEEIVSLMQLTTEHRITLQGEICPLYYYHSITVITHAECFHTWSVFQNNCILQIQNTQI